MTHVEFQDELRLLSQGQPLSQDVVLSSLRQHGASMVQANKAMTLLFGMSLGTAKNVAAGHPAWQSARDAAEPLHEALAQYARLGLPASTGATPQRRHRY